MELASQECCLHSVLFTRRYVTFVLVIKSFVTICLVHTYIPHNYVRLLN